MKNYSVYKSRFVVLILGSLFLYIFLLNLPLSLSKIKNTYWFFCTNLSISKPGFVNKIVSTVKCAGMVLQTQSQEILDVGGVKKNLLSLHGYLQCAIGKTAIIDADNDKTVVKLCNNHLSFISKPMDFSSQAQSLVSFHNYLKAKNIPMVFVLAPTKINKYDPQLPRGIQDYQNDNADHLLDIIQKSGIEIIDIRDLYKTQPAQHYKNFYYTDTHWTAKYSLEAYRLIAENLSQKDITLNSDIKNLDFYNIVYNPETFDGILIRRVVGYTQKEYSFNLIPKFETNIRIKIICNGVTRYTHADKSRTCTKKLLFISDSFGSDIVKFLSYGFYDVEHINQNSGAVNVRQQTEAFQPDIVIFLINAGIYVGHFNL